MVRVLTLGVVIVGLVTATPAQAGLTAPRRVSPPGVLVNQSAVAVGGARMAVLMATAPAIRGRPHSLQARVGTATRLGPLQRLAGGGIESLQVAVGGDGTAVAAWTARPGGSRTVLRAAVAAPGHRFGRAQTLSQARELVLGGVGVSATGRAVVAWSSETSGRPMRVAVARAAGRFGRAQTLGHCQDWPAVTVAPNGTVVVAWLEPSTLVAVPSSFRVLAATLARDAARFTAPTELATIPSGTGSTSALVFAPKAASGPGGAAVSWRQVPGSEGGLVSHTSVASLNADDSFAPAAALPPSIYGHGLGGDPAHLALGIPVGGSTVALWHEVRTRGNTVTSMAVKTSLRPRGGAFSPATRLSATGWLAGLPQAGALRDRTVAAWGEYGRPGHRPRIRVAVRRVRRAWTTLPARPAPGLDAGSVAEAAAPHYAVVSWIQIRRTSKGGGRLYLTSYRP
ncbi:MAG: hypothetical protein ACXVSX_20765 [Solirubrobacteraceae bacterium]